MTHTVPLLPPAPNTCRECMERSQSIHCYFFSGELDTPAECTHCGVTKPLAVHTCDACIVFFKARFEAICFKCKKRDMTTRSGCGCLEWHCKHCKPRGGRICRRCWEVRPPVDLLNLLRIFCAFCLFGILVNELPRDIQSCWRGEHPWFCIAKKFSCFLLVFLPLF